MQNLLDAEDISLAIAKIRGCEIRGETKRGPVAYRFEEYFSVRPVRPRWAHSQAAGRSRDSHSQGRHRGWSTRRASVSAPIDSPHSTPALSGTVSTPPSLCIQHPTCRSLDRSFDPLLFTIGFFMVSLSFASRFGFDFPFLGGPTILKQCSSEIFHM